MAQKIYFPALQSDILFLTKKISSKLSSNWIWGLVFVIFSWFDFSIGIGVLWVIGIISFIKHIIHYYYLKELEEQGRVLFMEKKKNERSRNIGYMFISIVLLLSFNSLSMISFLFGFLVFYYLMKYIFYIPSTVFIAHDYELIIKHKRKQKIFDFSYPNRLRFVYNMISFDHPINGKDSWKDISMDRNKMNEIRLFLAYNYGKEMVLNPTTGLPYTI